MASQAIGSAGELIVQARLLVRGWMVGNVKYRRHDERACRRSSRCEKIAKYSYSRKSNGSRFTERAMVSGSKLEDGNPITEFSPLRPHHPLHSCESRGGNSKARFMRYTLATAHWRADHPYQDCYEGAVHGTD